MPDSLPNLPVWWTPDLALGSPDVNVRALNTRLSVFLAQAGTIHRALFGKPLVVTSANDGHHAEHSAHYLNAAVDLRSKDKTDGEQVLFGAILCYLGLKSGVGIFDERATPGQHWHCEDASLLAG
jgi:hypothetical protein